MSVVAEKFLNLLSKLPAILPRRPNVSKRSVLLVTSVGGLFALFITAIYMRRRRKALPSVNPEELQDQNRNIISTVRAGKRRRRPKSKRLDLSMLNAISRSQHRRENYALSESSTVSSVKSSGSRRSKFFHIPGPGTKEYYDAEKFYRKGVDAFENAVHQWEKASAVLGSEISDVSSGRSGRSSSMSHEARRKSRSRYNSESPSNDCKTPTSRSRRTSIGKLRATLEGANLPQKSETVLNSGDHIALVDDQLNLSTEIEQKLLLVMERAEKLQKTFDEVLYTDSETESDTDITLTGYDVDSDTASFVSAQEAWETRSLDEFSNQQHLTLYEAALEAVDLGRVRCRTIRTELLECFSDVEFLAKLHCVRQALNLMLEDTTVRDWLIDSGRFMIELILKSANRNTSHFIDSFARLIEYVKNPENWIQIEDELKGRKVVSMTFYDIVLDFIIMDSFDDLDRPPSQVITILHNRWLTNSIKESALSTAVWSVLKAKSGMLRYQEGFISKFYAVSETISPVLAWGFLGTEEKLKSDCEKFKSEVLSFLRGIFSFDQVRYTTKEQMSDDILHLARVKVQKVVSYFDNQQNW